MTIRGVDVSFWQPPDFPWPAAVAWGARFAFIRAGGGYIEDTGYERHRTNARAHGLLTGAYWALFHHNPPAYEPTIFDPLRQAQAFVSLLADDDELPAVVDVEKDGVTRQLLGAFVREFERLTTRRLLVYTSQMAWHALIGRGATEFARLGLWVTNYNGGALELPDIWQASGPVFVQDSGTGDIPGYDKNLDLDEFNGDEAAFAALTRKARPMPTTLISTGPKIGLAIIRPNQGMPLVRRALAAGWHWPLAKATDNAGFLLDVARESPQTLCIYRHVNKDLDGAQDVATWPAARMAATAAIVLKAAVDPLSDAERAAADWIEPVNEADPPGVAGWRAYGLYLSELVRQAEARGLRLALPAFSAGTPEWDEMQAFVGTGLFQLLKAGGHILTAHEGVLSAADPLAVGSIPGAPAVPGAGPMCWRYRYLLAILRPLGLSVPIVISEFYAGGGYSDYGGMLARLALYDREIRKDPEVLAVLPFTVDPDPTWQHSDYTPFYGSGELWQYIRLEKDLPNATGDPTVDAQTQKAVDAIHAAQGQLQTALDALATPAHWWEAWPVGVINPPRQLAALPTAIAMRDAAGAPLVPAIKRGNAMQVFERQADLLRVLAAPINGQLWWVRAEDLPVPAPAG